MATHAILILRLVLGVIFVYAAYTKLKESYTLFAISIDSYRILPPDAVFAVARTLPWVELAIGVWLLAGWRVAPAAIASTAILGGFFSMMLFAYGRGMTIDCGCFGLGEAISWKTLLRDGAMVCASAMLAILAWSNSGKSRDTAPLDATDVQAGLLT